MSKLPTDHAARVRFRDELNANFAVQANAGSGKTTAISERLAAMALDPVTAPLLKKTAVVTYTKKAAAQIGQRARNVLLRRLGESGSGDLTALDSLERAFFGTIHSFCLLLAQRYGQTLGINLNPTAIEEEENDQLWEEFLEADPMQFSSLPSVQIDAFFRHVSIESVFALAQSLDDSGTARRLVQQVISPQPVGPDEAVLAEILAAKPARKSLPFERNQANARRWVERFREEAGHLALPKPEGSAGGIEDLYVRLLRPLKGWLATAGSILAAELALRYREWRFERGIQTFADQIEAAVAILQNERTLELIRAEGWRVILDEAQDTDPKQFAVLVEIARPPGATLGAWPGPSPGPRPGHFCMVGDVQQSIYGNRADIRNFARHMKAFEDHNGGEKLVFSVTFRTPNAVADFLNATLPDSFGPGRSHNLGLAPKDGAPVQKLQVNYEPLVSGPANEDGAIGVIDFDLTGAKGVAQETAIEVAAIAAYLKEKGFERLGAKNWGEVCILAPRNEWLAVARRELEAAGLKVSVQMRKNRSGDSPPYAWLCGLLAVLCEPDDTFEWVGVLREVFGISDPLIAHDVRTEKIFHWDEPERHAEAIGEALRVLAPFVGRVDQEGDRLEDFAAQLFAACQLAAKARLVDPSGQLESELDGLLADAAQLGLEGQGVRGWRLSLLANLEKRRPFGRVSADAINLATSHSAKGLEWPVVIALGLGRKISSRSGSGFMLVPDAAGVRQVYFDGASLPAETKDSRERERVRELVRLLYVTLTRARRVLLLPREKSGRPIVDSSFRHLWDGLSGEIASAGEVDFPLRPESDRDEPDVPAPDEAPENAPAPALARRVLPHQLAHRPVDLIRQVLHESSLDEPLPFRTAEDPIEYGLWWHETMEFLPWSGSEEDVAHHAARRLALARERGFEERGSREWALFQAGPVWPRLREARWTRIAELSVFAPLRPGEWIDGVIDLVLQDPVAKEVWIVDWKTNRVHPKEESDALLSRLSAEYQAQLGAYGTCASLLFPDAAISVFLFATGIGSWAPIKWA